MNQEHIEKTLKALGADNVNPSGDDYIMCSCLHAPYHQAHGYGDDGKPSMRIHITEDDEPSKYNCFTCKSWGTVKQLVERTAENRDVDYSSLASFVDDVENEFYIPLYNDLIDRRKRKSVKFTCEVIKPRSDFISVESSKLAMTYLKWRNISDDAVELAGLKYDAYEKRIVFPIMDLEGDLYGYTSRAATPVKYLGRFGNDISKMEKAWFPNRKIKTTNAWDFGNRTDEELTCEPTYTNKSGKVFSSVYMKIRDYKGTKKSQLIIGQHLWTGDKPVFLVEGLFGYIHLLSIGANKYFNIGASMGANLSDHQAKRLISFGRPVFLLFDNDEAGKIALFGNNNKGAIDKLENNVINFVPKWPKVDSVQAKDLDIIYGNNGGAKIDGYVKNSRGEWYKADPDKLTLEDIIEMKLEASIF
ncbi:toprim domain-containing protein [bacterium]|nr:toprim domain-containing protein [bacterium]